MTNEIQHIKKPRAAVYRTCCDCFFYWFQLPGTDLTGRSKNRKITQNSPRRAISKKGY